MSEKRKKEDASLNRVRKELKAKIDRCETCGSRDSLTYSHIIPVAQYPKLRDHEDNGMIQCLSCHREYDQGGLSAKVKQRTWPKCVAVMARLAPQYLNLLLSKLKD